MLKAILSENGDIPGTELFCAESCEMINFIKPAIDHQIKGEEIGNFIFTHPTRSESLNDLFGM